MIPRTREALSELLARTFPHSQDIDPATLDAFVDGLMRAKTQGAKPSAAKPPGSLAREHSLFTLRATHARRTPITSVFTGVTHCVRVRLPRSEAATIDTQIGEVRPEDHLLPTVDAVRERFGSQIGRPFARVDLLTPARSASVRFSPMALYFGYERDDSEAPSFIVYEPGDALGKPGALYFGETLATVIETRAGYKPTPLSSPDHWYTGGVRMAANGNDPEVLYMRAAEQRGGEPHFRLHVEYAVAETIPDVSPIGDLVEAALRMLAVQHGAGADQNLIERLVAETGLLALDWIDRPDNGPPREQRDLRAAAFEPSRAFEPFLAELSASERATLEASVALLLGAVVRADGKFDRLERIEFDWTMNFEVPSALGDAFRFSDAATREVEAVLEDPASLASPAFERRLAELAPIISRMPNNLREQYSSFLIQACAAAAEASGGWLWFGSKVGDAERRVLDRIASALGLGH